MKLIVLVTILFILSSCATTKELVYEETESTGGGYEERIKDWQERNR